MDDKRQYWFNVLGESGCYVMSIVRLAEEYTQKYIDSYRAFRDGVIAGYVKEDCFVVDPSALLTALTERPWTMTKEDSSYATKPGELEILRYERQEVGKTIGHFVTGNGQGQVDYDPYGSSITVASGKLISKRIFRLA